MCRPSPGDPESRERSCAEQIISTLARRAFRRPLTEADLQTLFEFYETGRTNGGFEAGVKLALQRILVSPYFLFRVEQDPTDIPPGAPYRLTDLESRPVYRSSSGAAFQMISCWIWQLGES